MFIKRALAGTALAAMLAAAVPAAPALADGKASTRNILFGLGAATYLIIQHNRKVHEKYAEYDRRQAELKSENSDAWAAYSSEKGAYSNAMAEIVDLKREVAYQHHIILQQRHQLAMTGGSRNFNHQVAYAPPSRTSHRTASHSAKSHAAPSKHDVAMVSYGWGQI